MENGIGDITNLNSHQPTANSFSSTLHFYIILKQILGEKAFSLSF